ncbi:helix-turn-helix transcriptional regulator [Caloranaerobacter sp. DY30410]|uniref:helix-turn-helix transcriptional regulator n=1 Tax=Caloranaerobacter sp. DY30410 TaxID=3238305 RepID=UPI003D005B6E
MMLSDKAQLKLKSLRVNYNITQDDMAQLLNISVQTYNKKENGKSEFTQSEINKILSLFDVKYEEIFFNENVRNTRTKETA